MILETVEVLVPLLAHIALVWLLLLHSLRAGVRSLSVRVDNRECAVAILVQPLVIVAMLSIISTILHASDGANLQICGT